MTRLFNRLLDRPAPAILAMTAACLIVFGATVPLPRADGQLVGSDGIKYYVYLPSLLIDGDLDFTDEYRHFYRSHRKTAAYLVADRTPTGLPANRFGIGPAILWAPFFIAAHLLAVLLSALGFSIASDGYGAFYQVPVLAGSILYGGLGAWLCFRAALRVASQKAALAATLLTILAGNQIYYLTVEPSMSHSLSMFASASFFYVWVTSRDRPRRWDHVRLGGLAGLMALIRPQDGLFLLLPIADQALSSIKAGRAGRGNRSGWLTSSLWMVASAILVFLPQLVVWRLLNGALFLSGYGREFDGLFHWPFSRLLPVLFSAHRGLFTWHPVFLLGLAGLWLLMARAPRQGDRQFAESPGTGAIAESPRTGAIATSPRTGAIATSPRTGAIAVLGFSGFVIQWLVVSSWHQWTQGDAFGGRMFIVCTSFFVFGTAALLDAAARHWPMRRILAGGMLLVVLNFLLIVNYRTEIIYLERLVTYSHLVFGRFELP